MSAAIASHRRVVGGHRAGERQARIVAAWGASSLRPMAVVDHAAARQTHPTRSAKETTAIKSTMKNQHKMSDRKVSDGNASLSIGPSQVAHRATETAAAWLIVR